MRSRVIKLFAGAAVLLGLSGCVRAPLFVPGAALTLADSAKLCSSLNAGRQMVRSFRALADATVASSDNESASFRYAIAGKSGDRLRIDVLPQEGAFTLAMITVRGEQALFLDTQARRAIEGCSVAQVLERLLGLEGMTPAAVEALVVGQAPPLECSRVTAYHPREERVLFVDSSESIAWEINEATGTLASVSFLDSQRTKVTADAHRSIAVDGQTIITVNVHKPAQAIANMSIVKFSKNSDINESLFEVAIPAGYEREGC